MCLWGKVNVNYSMKFLGHVDDDCYSRDDDRRLAIPPGAQGCKDMASEISSFLRNGFSGRSFHESVSLSCINRQSDARASPHSQLIIIDRIITMGVTHGPVHLLSGKIR